MEYFFGKEGEFDADLEYIGINRRRLVLNVAVATTLALGRSLFFAFFSMYIYIYIQTRTETPHAEVPINPIH
jgi:hypothetical protein